MRNFAVEIVCFHAFFLIGKNANMLSISYTICFMQPPVTKSCAVLMRQKQRLPYPSFHLSKANLLMLDLPLLIFTIRKSNF